MSDERAGNAGNDSRLALAVAFIAIPPGVIAYLLWNWVGAIVWGLIAMIVFGVIMFIDEGDRRTWWN